MKINLCPITKGGTVHNTKQSHAGQEESTAVPYDGELWFTLSSSNLSRTYLGRQARSTQFSSFADSFPECSHLVDSLASGMRSE